MQKQLRVVVCGVCVWRSGVRRRRRASEKTLGKNGERRSDRVHEQRFFSPLVARRRRTLAAAARCVCARCACVRMAGSCVSEQCVVGGGVTDARSTTTASDVSITKRPLRRSRLSHGVGVFRKWRSCGGHREKKARGILLFSYFPLNPPRLFSPVLFFFFFLCEYKLCHIANMAGTRCIFTPLPL